MTPKGKGKRKNVQNGTSHQQAQAQAQSQYQQQQDDNPYHTHHDGTQEAYYDSASLIASVQAARQQSMEHLNLSVLRRFEPTVMSIVSIAPYAVLYVFVQADQTWEKSGIEGTLFITACTPDSAGADRFRVILLNRRGLDNFSSELGSPDDVDVTEEYIIIKGDISEAEQDPDYGDDEGPQIYGLWIFAEPEPSSTANMREYTGQVIVTCASIAAESRRVRAEQETALLAQELVNTQTSPGVVEDGAAAGRQLSLLELFGQTRAQDSGFSTNNHSAPPVDAPVQHTQYMQQQSVPPQQASKGMFMTNPDTEFFRTGTTSNPRPSQVNGGQLVAGASIPVDHLFQS